MPRTAALALLVLAACGSPTLTLESARVHGLLAQMSHPDRALRERAELELGRLGPTELPVLIEGLECGDAKLRWAAAFVLGPMGPRAKAALPALSEALDDGDAAIRVRALQAIAEIDPGEAGTFARMLRDPDADVRRVAAAALIGAKGREAIPALIEALKDADPGIRWRACAALGRIGTGVPVLIDLLDDPDAEVRSRAAEALMRIGPGPELREAAEGEGKVAAAAKAILAAPEPAPPPDAGVAARAAEYRQAKVGLFVHWGLHAVAHRAKPGASPDRVQDEEKISEKDYEKLAAGFNASKFDAADWVRIAKDAGARFLFLTAKPADGFCLWDTRLTEFNSKRDLVGELAQACGKGGLKFGVSYSMLDWHHPDFDDRFPKYVDFLHAQVRELLTKVPVWSLWLDGEWGRRAAEWRADELIAAVRKLRPKAVVLDRLGRGADFVPDGEVTIGTGRGYSESPDPLKSGERLIGELAEAVSKGGSFLIGVGPRADGTIPGVVQERLRTVGAWLRKNGEAVYDTERGPFGGPLPVGRVTMKGTRLYLFLEELPKGPIVLPGLKDHVKRAWLLDGGKELELTLFGISPPEKLVDPTFTVVAVELDAPPRIDR